MPEGDSSENILQDVKDFTSSFAVFHQAFPDENQHIVGQIFKQIIDADKSDTDYIQSNKGQEQIWIFERKGVKVYKRVFHPGTGEKLSGADFILYKITANSNIKVTAVQVKRNHNKSYFEFDERDLKQFDKFSKWRSAYYLMVDETIKPPLYCFVNANEMSKLIGPKNRSQIKIPNSQIRNLCRGLKQFYDLFYRCFRGSKYVPEEYKAKLSFYVKETNRAIVEISTQKINNRKRKKRKQTDLPDYTNGRISGLIDSL